MKQLFLMTLIGLISLQASSNEYVCKDIYESKIKRMHKNVNKKRIAAIIASPFVLAGVGIAVTVSLPAGLISGGLVGSAALTNAVAVGGGLGAFVGVPTGIVTFSDFFDNRADRFDSSLRVQKLMHISHDELIEQLIIEREELLKTTLTQFDNNITHLDYFNKIAEQVNQERFEQSLPALSSEEAVNFRRKEIEDDISTSEISVYNDISHSLWMANSISRREMTYDEWRLILQDNQEEFCPKKKPLKLSKVIKNLSQKGII